MYVPTQSQRGVKQPSLELIVGLCWARTGISWEGGGESVTKNLSSLFPPAPEPRLRRPTWPITCDALLFFPLSSQVSSHPAPSGPGAHSGGSADPEPADQAEGRLCPGRGPLSPSSSQSWCKAPLHPQLKKKATKHTATWIL